ncbi:MAG: hypothetical protein ACYC91_04150 [Solirubrobacteraceae bacterium]
MSLLASADTKTLWEVSLGVGVVVVVVVIVLMALLLSFVKDIEVEAEALVAVGGELGQNTSAIPQLATTATVLEEIRTEALIHADYLSSQVGRG